MKIEYLIGTLTLLLSIYLIMDTKTDTGTSKEKTRTFFFTPLSPSADPHSLPLILCQGSSYTPDADEKEVSEPQKAVVVGGSGAVGRVRCFFFFSFSHIPHSILSLSFYSKALVNELLASPDWSEVVTLGRRDNYDYEEEKKEGEEEEEGGGKLTQIAVDFDEVSLFSLFLFSLVHTPPTSTYS